MHSIEDNLDTVDILLLIGKYYHAKHEAEYYLKKALEKIEIQKKRRAKALDNK